MKAPFPYHGGKTAMAKRIIELLPPHSTYIEPFFGGGSVLMAKPLSCHEIVNDIDGDLVTFWRVLRDRTEELEAACTLTPHARDEFVAAKDTDVDDDIERARRIWVRLNQSFGKTLSRHTGWSATTARTQSIPASIAARIGRFADVAERLRNVTIENCDAVSLIERLATADTAMYVDPPYVASTRSAKDAYQHEMSDADHARLLAVLASTPAAVVLSGYASDMYDAALDGWHRIEIHTTAATGNVRGAKRGKRIEVLWTNRALSHEMFPEVAS